MPILTGVRHNTKRTWFRRRLSFNKGAPIASAATITLGTDGNVFPLTGTTTIDFITITDWEVGSLVVLHFSTSITVNHNTSSPGATVAAILLSAAGNFSGTANDTLGLIWDGTSWREAFRTAV